MSAFVETNGIRLHYREHGYGEETMVFMPGLTANCESLGGLVAEGLSDAIRILAVDLRGRGLSDHPDDGYTIEEQARDVLGLLDALGLERVILSGHSYGGLLTYYLAAEHPDRVSKCVVIDTPPGVVPMVIEQARPSIDRLGKPVPSWQAYLDAIKAQPTFADFWNDEIEAYYLADVHFNADGTVQSRSSPENIMAAIEAPISVDWEDILSRVTRPTLLVRAIDPYGPPGYPPMVSRDLAERSIELLADGRLIELPGNHVTLLFGEYAPAVVDAISEFLADGSSDSSPDRGR